MAAESAVYLVGGLRVQQQQLADDSVCAKIVDLQKQRHAVFPAVNDMLICELCPS